MLLWTALACGDAGPDRVMVVVAKRELSVGVPIGPDDVYGYPMRPNDLPDGVFFTPDAVLGRVPAERILPNEPIRSQRLANQDLQRMLAEMVPPGLEVWTVQLDPFADRMPMAGLDTMDVVLTDRLGVAEVVAQDLQVLRVDRDQVAVMAPPPVVRAHEAVPMGSHLTVTIHPRP